jgi:DNA polymerase
VVIVVGSAGPETGDLFSDVGETPGEGVPDVHSSGAGRAEGLRRLSEWTLNCRRCPLEATRKNIVFGEGSPEAKLVFVGEAPGADEDATGRPFVGRAGQLLDKIVAAMGLAREAVYICNVLKCRPPENRTPSPSEIAACSPVLREQLRVLNPPVIVALGSPAARTLLGTNLGITKIRGRFHFYHGIAVMPTFHPAYLLRNPGEEYKRMVWEDMKAVLARLGLEAPRRQPR